MNTSSCLGLFKEIIVDRSFDGEVLPAAVGVAVGVALMHVWGVDMSLSMGVALREWVYVCPQK